ncbi:hypothetical protein N9Y00_06990 [Tateyamaria sp.]|nr:hypothetical protein [Tateyamaria sp.]
MKLETLAKRLALKTDAPELEKVVLGQADITTLSMECMLWTGAAQGVSPRPQGKIRRDRSNHREIARVHDRPYGIVRWQGKTISVHRLIFQLAMKPNYEFRMWSTCEVPFCCNPMHFHVEQVEREILEPDPTITIGPKDDDIWSEEEVEEILDSMLGNYDLTSWDDVIKNPMIAGEDIPQDLFRQVLCKMNKDHLT